MKKFCLKNVVTLGIGSENIEKLLNGCKREGILIENFRKTPDGYEGNVSFRDFRKIRRAALGVGVRIKIIKKKGAGYYVHMRRKRYGFYLGALMFLVIMCYLTSCIWVVDIIGNTNTDAKEILRVMDEYGIGTGKLRYNKKISEIKNRALLELDSLAWLWVRIEGTRAIVEVREKGDGEKIIDKGQCCNIIASYPGQILDMRVRSGRKVVNRGDVVDRGDLLVSGISDTKYRGVRFIHAYGEVFARTWREAEGEFAPFSITKTKTGNIYKKRTLTVLETGIPLFHRKKIPFKNYTLHKKEKQIRIFKNIYLPIIFTTETFYEIIENNEPMSQEETLEYAVNNLVCKIENERTVNSQTLNTDYTFQKLQNGNLYVKVILESKENISAEQPVEVELLTEENTGGESN